MGQSPNIAKRSGSTQCDMAHISLGCRAVTRGKRRKAIAECREAVRLNPESPLARNNLGIALSATGKLDEAIAEFRCAIRLKPDYLSPTTTSATS